MATRVISRDDPQPLYKQLKLRLLEDLAASDLTESMKLASERELVAAYGVSRITVRQAMNELVHEGFVRSQPGKGFYATGRRETQAFELELLRSFTATAIEHGMSPGSRLLHVRPEPATEQVAASLQMKPGAAVVALRRLRLLDDRPVAITEDWIDAGKAPEITSLDWASGNRSLYDTLRNRYGLRPARGETVLSSRLATPEECELLELAAPAAVLTVEQVAYDRNGASINMTLSVQHPTRYPLRLEQGAGRS